MSYTFKSVGIYIKLKLNNAISFSSTEYQCWIFLNYWKNYKCYSLIHINSYSLAMLSCSYFSYLRKFLPFSHKKKDCLQDIPFRIMNDNYWIVDEQWIIQFGRKLWLLVTKKTKKRLAGKQITKPQQSYLISSELILFHCVLWITELIYSWLHHLSNLPF